MLLAMFTVMQFGVSTWLWVSPFNKEAHHLLESIKAMGFDYVEIPIEDPSLIDINSLSAVLEDTDLGVLLCGAFGPGRDLANESDRVVKETLSYITKCCEIGEKLGVPFLAGPMYSEVGKEPASSESKRKKQFEKAVTNLKVACGIAKDFGMDLAIEPLNRFESDLVNTAEDLVELIQQIDDPAAKACLDGFHMNIEETDFRKAINQLGSKLIHVQVSENHRGIPGTGNTDWNGFRSGLSDIGYNKGVTIESFTPHNRSLANAVCIWKRLASSQSEFAGRGLTFLKEWCNNEGAGKLKPVLERESK